MADIRAIASTAWFTGSTWNGGVPPGVGDNAFANGFTVNIDGNITCTSINTTAGGGGVAGGGFTCTVARTINANITPGSTTCLTCTHTSGTVVITGNVTGSATTNSQHGVSNTGVGGAISFVGNLTGGTASSTHAFSSGSAAAVSVTGNIFGAPSPGNGSYGINSASGLVLNLTHVGNATGGSGNNCNAVLVQAGANVNFSGGTITGGTGAGANGYYLQIGTATGTFTGNIVGANAVGLNVGGNLSSYTITGNLIGASGGLTNPAFYHTGSSPTIVINGDCTAFTGPGANIQCSGGTTTLTGTVTGGSVSTANYGFGLTGGTTATINGNVSSGTVGFGASIAITGATLTINGNVSAANATATNTHGVTMSNNANLTVNGNVLGGNVSNNLGVNAATTGSVSISGTCEAGTGVGCYGMQATGAGTFFVGTPKSNNYPNSGIVNANWGVNLTAQTQSCTIDALEYGSGGVAPHSAVGKFFIRAAGTNSVKMRESNAGAVVEMGEIAANYPAITDVRDGVVYNSGGLTGSCKVPGAGSVAFGVPVDATTGTAVLTQQGAADAIGPLLVAYFPD